MGDAIALACRPAYRGGMNGTTVDALDATRTLREAGFEDRQAEAVAGVVRYAVNAGRDTLAAKADVIAVRADIRADIAGLEARIYRTLWIQAGAIVGVVVAAVKLL